MNKIINIKNRKLIISLSFANYLKEKSGMPKVIMAHQNIYNKNSISYVYLFSVKKNILRDRIMLFCKFGLIIDGQYYGIYQMSQIINMIYEWSHKGKEIIDIHIHHLLYVNLNLVDELLSHVIAPVKVYLHDYYNACSNYTLLKNNEQYCGGEGLNEINCKNCKFYKESCVTQNAIHRLYNKFISRIKFIAPSSTVQRIFIKFHPEYEDKIIIIPHQKLDGNYKENLSHISQDEGIRIAFLGMPAKHKGWDTWSKIVNIFTSNKYQFFVFNSSDDCYSNMQKVNVRFTQNNMNAMVEALRENKINVAILWALWPETYSYTYFEAFSANVFVITNKNSGNIADAVEKNKNGIVLQDEGNLISLFYNDKKLYNLINSFRYNSLGGPNRLLDNDEIVDLSLKFNETSKIIKKFKICNYPLLWILNYIDKKNII